MLKQLHILFLFTIAINSFSQTDSLSIKRNRKIVLASSAAVLTGGSLFALDKAWYASYSNGKFHFFNDNAEWLQMDKFGHAWTTYNTGRLMMEAFDWAGFSRKQKLFLGGTIGFAYMTCIEVLDGFSSGWGFSYGDMIANAAGSIFAISQQALWNEQKIFYKYTYHESGYASYNPNLLGSSLPEKLLKDYNAQIYWLSFSPFAFTKKDSKLPKWLAISLGYGASGMVRATENFITYSSPSSPNVQYTVRFERVRNFYLSLDLDLTKIKTKSKVLKTIFTCLNTIKVPAPAIGLNKHGTTFYWAR